ncbi:FAD-dependent oxidoreductase [Aeromonas sp. 31P]
MATVIVIGAGLGGMSAAYELKAELGKQHEVILINDKPDFEFTHPIRGLPSSGGSARRPRSPSSPM